MSETPISEESKISPGTRKSAWPWHVLMLRMARDQDGATAIEYALIASGIGAAVAATVWSLGTATKDLYVSVDKLF